MISLYKEDGSCDLSQGIYNIVMCDHHSVLAWYDDITGHTHYRAAAYKQNIVHMFSKPY